MNRKLLIPVVAAIAALLAVGCSKKTQVNQQFIKPERGSISVELRLNGSVEPRNRLEIKPQVAGRMEEILVVEGQRVRKGETLAWMSSTDRAALLDAARAKSEDEVKRWENIYRPAPLVSPLDGFVIARSREPGQSVSLSDTILVMADTLIVTANVDETDLRYIRTGTRVSIALDAYPDNYFSGTVEHVAYESQVISNVTVYEVKIRPEKVPAAFRSGMTASIICVAQKKDDALLLPVEAIQYTGTQRTVQVALAGKQGESEQRLVKTGITDGKNIEILEGIDENNLIVVTGKKLVDKRAVNMRGPGSLFGVGTKKSTTTK